MNILVHTWWLSADKGSEFSVAYNFVREMSKFHHLYVPVESCSYAWNDLSEFGALKMRNVEFIFVGQTFRMNFVHFFQSKMRGVLGGWFSYALFNQWEKSLYKKIKSAYLDKIDLIHYLGPIGYHEPGYLWKLPMPYVWGAIGGFENVHSDLLESYMSSKRIMKFKQRLNAFEARHHGRVRRAMERASVVIAATGGNRKIIEENYHVKSLKYFPENVMRISRDEIMSEDAVRGKFAELARGERVRVIWCGTLTARKMPNLLSDILRAVLPCGKFYFDIVGGGEHFAWLKKDLQKVDGGGYMIYGKIPRTQVDDLWKTAHVHLLTSAYEGNSTVIFEAMENCIPTIAFNVCGMADTVTDNNGIKIAPAGYDENVKAFSDALLGIAENPELLLKKALRLREDSFSYAKEARFEFYEKVYREAMENYGKRN